MEILYLIIGLLIGGLSGWFIGRQLLSSKKGIKLQDVETRYVLREIYQEEKRENTEKEKLINDLNIQLTRITSDEKNLRERNNAVRTGKS